MILYSNVFTSDPDLHTAKREIEDVTEALKGALHKEAWEVFQEDLEHCLEVYCFGSREASVQAYCNDHLEYSGGDVSALSYDDETHEVHEVQFTDEIEAIYAEMEEESRHEGAESALSNYL